jgi:hypothetical protein
MKKKVDPFRQVAVFTNDTTTIGENKRQWHCDLGDEDLIDSPWYWLCEEDEIQRNLFGYLVASIHNLQLEVEELREKVKTTEAK